jgi:uncharacterized membrane protein
MARRSMPRQPQELIPVAETILTQTNQGDAYVAYEEELVVVVAEAAPIDAQFTVMESATKPTETGTKEAEAQVIPIEGEPASPEATDAPLTAVAAFDGSQSAEQALHALKDAGFAADQVSMVARVNRETIPAEGQDDAIRDAEIGAAGAGVLGGAVGWLLGISALALPGIGPIVGVGILWTTLAGAGIGAAAGGLGGALVGHGVDQEHAEEYEEHVRQGRNLVTVHTADQAQQQKARAILERVGGTDVRAYGEASI